MGNRIPLALFPWTFDTIQGRLYTDGMEVHLSPDKQARLQEIASRVGKDAEQIVEEAVDRMLEHLDMTSGLFRLSRKDAPPPGAASCWSTMKSSNASTNYCVHDESAVDRQRLE